MQANRQKSDERPAIRSPAIEEVEAMVGAGRLVDPAVSGEVRGGGEAITTMQTNGGAAFTTTTATRLAAAAEAAMSGWSPDQRSGSALCGGYGSGE